MPSVNQMLPFFLLGVYALAKPVQDIHRVINVSSDVSSSCFIAGVLIEDAASIRAKLRGDDGRCGITGDDKALFDVLLTKCINYNPNNEVCLSSMNVYPDSIFSLAPAVARTPSILIGHALNFLRKGGPGGDSSGNGGSGGSGEASGVPGGDHSSNGSSGGSGGPGGDRNGGPVKPEGSGGPGGLRGDRPGNGGSGSSDGGVGGPRGSGDQPGSGGPSGLTCKPTV